MKRLVKRLALLLYCVLMYYVIFGMLVFAVHQPMPSDLDYDTNRMRTTDDEATWAYLVESRTHAFDVRLALIESATERIDMTTYLIRTDHSRNILFGALLEAADRGVEVRLVIDGAGMLGLYGQNRAYRDALAAHPNITLALFEPITPFPPYALQNMLHDKLWVIDERYGMVGGRNVGDRYYLESMPAEASTHDRDVLVYGDETIDAVADMIAYIDELFAYEHTELLNASESHDTASLQTMMKDAHDDYVDERGLDATLIMASIHADAIAINRATFLRSPLERMHKSPVIVRTLVELAEHYDDIFVQTPFFVLDRALLEELDSLQGKTITMLTNSPAGNPNYPALSGYMLVRERFAAQGTVYEYQGSESLHAKTVMMGNDITIIGSLNIDPRSAFLSTESVIVIYSESFNAHIHEVIAQEYLAQSLQVDATGDYLDGPIEPLEMSDFRRITLRVLSVFARLFSYML